jgi:hypothetical protein
MPLLRQLGLEPGRARANARPSPERVRAQRIEQFRFIVANCARRNDIVERRQPLASRDRAR